MYDIEDPDNTNMTVKVAVQNSVSDLEEYSVRPMTYQTTKIDDNFRELPSIVPLSDSDGDCLFQQELDATLSDEVSVTGSVGFDIWIEVKFDIKKGNIEFGIVTHTVSKGELFVGCKGEVFDKDANKGEYTKSIYKKKLPNFQFTIGYVPIVITNDFKATLDASVQLEGSIGTTIALETKRATGFEYNSKTGKITEINENSYSDDGLDWKAEAKAEGMAEAGVYAHLITKLYGCAGADLAVGIMGNVNGEVAVGIDENACRFGFSRGRCPYVVRKGNRLYKIGRVKETTVYRMRQTYSSCKKEILGMMKLQEVRAIHVQQHINTLHGKGYTYGTLRLLKSLLNEMFKRAIGNGYMLINPCDAVVLPPKEKYEQRYLTEEEQEMFLDVAREYYHYDIFCACLSMGARIGEVLGLKWSDIDFEKKTIHIQRTLHYARLVDDESCHFFFTTPKTESGNRKIPLLAETEAILRRVRKKQLRNKMLFASTWEQEPPFEDMVFTSQTGMPVRYGDVNRTIKIVITKANLQEEELAKLENREPHLIKEFSPHCFRHTFVTRCRMKGIPYETIQPYVGHSDKEMTAYYDHNKPEVDYSKLKEASFLNVV